MTRLLQTFDQRDRRISEDAVCAPKQNSTQPTTIQGGSNDSTACFERHSLPNVPTIAEGGCPAAQYLYWGDCPCRRKPRATSSTAARRNAEGSEHASSCR